MGIQHLALWAANQALLHALKQGRFEGMLAAAPRDPTHAQAQLEASVRKLFNPFDDAADQAASAMASEILAHQRPDA